MCRLVRILNTGAHIHNTLFHNEVVGRVADYLSGYKGRLYYRTTYPGHPFCGAYFGRGPERNETEEFWEYPDLYSTEYSWDLFKDYNAYAVPVGALVADKALLM
jgi:hypothetical protein